MPRTKQQKPRHILDPPDAEAGSGEEVKEITDDHQQLIPDVAAAADSSPPQPPSSHHHQHQQPECDISVTSADDDVSITTSTTTGKRSSDEECNKIVEEHSPSAAASSRHDNYVVTSPPQNNGTAASPHVTRDEGTNGHQRDNNSPSATTTNNSGGRHPNNSSSSASSTSSHHESQRDPSPIRRSSVGGESGGSPLQTYTIPHGWASRNNLLSAAAAAAANQSSPFPHMLPYQSSPFPAIANVACFHRLLALTTALIANGGAGYYDPQLYANFQQSQHPSIGDATSTNGGAAAAANYSDQFTAFQRYAQAVTAIQTIQQCPPTPTRITSPPQHHVIQPAAYQPRAPHSGPSPIHITSNGELDKQQQQQQYTRKPMSESPAHIRPYHNLPDRKNYHPVRPPSANNYYPMKKNNDMMMSPPRPNSSQDTLQKSVLNLSLNSSSASVSSKHEDHGGARDYRTNHHYSVAGNKYTSPSELVSNHNNMQLATPPPSQSFAFQTKPPSSGGESSALAIINKSSPNRHAVAPSQHQQITTSLGASIVNNVKEKMKGRDPENMYIQCQICHKRIKRLYHFHRHMRIHTGEKTHQCPYCHYKSVRKDNLKSHMKTHEKHMNNNGGGNHHPKLNGQKPGVNNGNNKQQMNNNRQQQQQQQQNSPSMVARGAPISNFAVGNPLLPSATFPIGANAAAQSRWFNFGAYRPVANMQAQSSNHAVQFPFHPNHMFWNQTTTGGAADIYPASSWQPRNNQSLLALTGQPFHKPAASPSPIMTSHKRAAAFYLNDVTTTPSPPKQARYGGGRVMTTSQTAQIREVTGAVSSSVATISSSPGVGGSSGGNHGLNGDSKHGLVSSSIGGNNGGGSSSNGGGAGENNSNSSSSIFRPYSMEL